MKPIASAETERLELSPCCVDLVPADPRSRARWLRIVIAAVIAINSMTLDVAVNTSDATPSERLALHAAALAGTLLTFGLLGWPLACAAFAELRRRRLTIEAMFVLGILGALVASLVAMATGKGAVYFEVAGVLLVVYALGQQLVGSVRRRALVSIDAWAGPATCEVLADDGSTRTQLVADVMAGQRVLVQPGRTIPVDGVVESGEAFVREAELTGEAFLRPRTSGERVWAGTHTVDGALVVRASTSGRERRIDAITAAIEVSRAAPAALQRQADRLIAWFLPLVVMIALVTLLIWRALDGWQAGVYNAMTVLLIACPCALGLATPIAIWRALAELAARGLVVHGGETVEKLAAVDTVVFDKTGTITEIEPVLAELLIDPSSGLVQDDVREILARIEHGSAHPLAQAFAASTDERPARWQLRAVRLLPGAGVASEVVGRADGVALRVTLGTPSRLLATEKQQRAWRQLLGDRQRSAEPIVLLIDDRVCAAAFVTERARPDWAATSAALATAGLKLIVMTGDRAEHAEAVFSGAVAAGLSPQDKLARVAELRRRGHTVLFVGDGVNDAAAMAAADVSIAAGSGADLARAVADATWLGGRLAVLAEAHALALAAVRRIRSSFAFAVAYNIVGITLAAVGMLHPVVAAIVMTCSSLVVTWRAAGFAAGDAPNATEEAAVTSSAEAQWQT